MHVSYVLLYIFTNAIFILAVNADEPSKSCITPNGENATCVPIKFCGAIIKSLITFQTDAVEFSKLSQCGFDQEPYICCGSVAHFIDRLEPPQNSHLPAKELCGLNSGNNKIIGGRVASIREFAWTALLHFRNDDDTPAGFLCGGTLINSRYVLTAAHCVSRTTELIPEFVRLGEWRISTDSDCEQYSNMNMECSDLPVDIKLESILIHPNYSRVNKQNDIALLKLQGNISYTDFIRPICLVPEDFDGSPPGKKLTAVGWGATENEYSSDIKLKVDVPVVSTDKCIETYSESLSVRDNQLCAGGLDGKDTCTGDSGGPLMRSFWNKDLQKYRWFLEGIVSWGRGCGIENQPAIYTRVSKYVEWILNNLE